MTDLTIDHDYITRQTQAMVAIDSTNPGLTAGAVGEAAMGQFVAAALRNLGIAPIIHPVQGDRANVSGVLKGTGGGKTLLLNAHLDTVGPGAMDDPFGGDIRDGKLYGRGSYDMKASIAAMLGALKSFVDAGVQPQGDVVFTTVIDEEHGSIGMEHLVTQFHADAAIVTEPTDLRLCTAHRGFVWLVVETHGRAAHGSRQFEGIDANMHMGRVLVGVERLLATLLAQPGHPLLGTPSLHAPLIKGGASQAVYSDYCRMELERRTLPGERNEAVLAEVQAVLDELAEADPDFRAAARVTFSRPPFEVRADSAIASAVQAATNRVTGTSQPVVGASFWTDAALLQAAGIPSVLLGPVGAGLHSDEEWVDVASIGTLTGILQQTIAGFCGTA